MNKFVIILALFGLLSCNEYLQEKNQIVQQKNFQPQFYENIHGTCNSVMASYIDGSNGNLCYVASNCYGISVFCMSKAVK